MEDPNWVIKKDLESLAHDHWPRRNLQGVLDLGHFLECRLPYERLCEDVYAESVRVLRLFLCLREWRTLALTAEACQRVNTYSCMLINSYVHKYLNRVQVWYMVNSSVYEGFWKRKCTKYYVNISYRRLDHQQDFKLRIFCHPGSEIWLEFLPLFSWLGEISSGDYLLLTFRQLASEKSYERKMLRFGEEVPDFMYFIRVNRSVGSNDLCATLIQAPRIITQSNSRLNADDCDYRAQSTVDNYCNPDYRIWRSLSLQFAQ